MPGSHTLTSHAIRYLIMKVKRSKNTLKRILWLKDVFSVDPIPFSIRRWDTANVIITHKPPPGRQPGESPPKEQYVVTSWDGELSWVFLAVCNTFRDAGLMDELAAYSVFGRMAAAVNTLLLYRPTATPNEVCIAAIEETEQIYSDMVMEYCNLQTAGQLNRAGNDQQYIQPFELGSPEQNTGLLL